ncbi:hypothetical protein Tco_1115149 [Tanacetum coccineum]
MQFLMGLDERYLAMRSNILTREPLPLIGYIVDRCFKIVGYPTGYVKKNFNANTRPVSSNNAFAYADVHSNNVSINNAATSNSPIFFSNEQLARLMSLLNDNGVSIANANMVDMDEYGFVIRLNMVSLTSGSMRTDITSQSRQHGKSESDGYYLSD